MTKAKDFLIKILLLVVITATIVFYIFYLFPYIGRMNVLKNILNIFPEPILNIVILVIFIGPPVLFLICARKLVIWYDIKYNHKVNTMVASSHIIMAVVIGIMIAMGLLTAVFLYIMALAASG